MSLKWFERALICIAAFLFLYAVWFLYVDYTTTPPQETQYETYWHGTH